MKKACTVSFFSFARLKKSVFDRMACLQDVFCLKLNCAGGSKSFMAQKAIIRSFFTFSKTSLSDSQSNRSIICRIVLLRFLQREITFAVFKELAKIPPSKQLLNVSPKVVLTIGQTSVDDTFMTRFFLLLIVSILFPHQFHHLENDCPIIILSMIIFIFTCPF